MRKDCASKPRLGAIVEPVRVFASCAAPPENEFKNVFLRAKPASEHGFECRKQLPESVALFEVVRGGFVERIGGGVFVRQLLTAISPLEIFQSCQAIALSRHTGLRT